MSRRAFSPHMLLHLGVAVVAAPKIAVGLARARRGVELRQPLLLALAASALEMVVVWGWHVPALHEAAAALDGRFFVAQQGSFLLAGLFLWTVSFSSRSRASCGVGILLSLAPQLLYAPELCLGSFGLDRLDDQRFGGALMAVGGGLPYLLGGSVLAYRFISD